MNVPPRPGALWVVAGALLDGPRCFAAKRPPGGSAGEKWEFPGGKVEKGEPPRSALVRELREELSLEVRVGDFVGRSEFFAGDRTIVLDVYFVERVSGTLALTEHLESTWVGPADLEALDWALADRPLLPRILEALRSREPRARTL